MEPRTRNRDYPSIGLREAIEKLRKLHSAIGRHPASRESVAKGMGYTGLNGASASAVGALNKYGMLERQGEDLRISERGMSILYAHNPSERADAIKAAAGEPRLFGELLERYPGKPPADEVIRTYLVRQGLNASAVTAAVSAFRETVDLVDSESEVYSPLSLPGRGESTGSLPMAAIASQASQQVLNYVPESPQDERPIGRYDFEGGSYVRIVVGGDLDTESALDMAETLIKLKRQELARRTQRDAIAGQRGEKEEEEKEGIFN